jgi:hypothetical protein
MSKIVELYVKELTREGSTMTINDVPKKLRKQVEVAGKEEREMLVRLYAGEIIMGRITEDDVPAKLKARVHKYLVDMGYFDDVEE